MYKEPLSAVKLAPMLTPSSASTLNSLKVEAAVSKDTLFPLSVASRVNKPEIPLLSAASTLSTVIDPELTSPI